MAIFRPFDEDLQNEFDGKNNRVPVNRSTYIYATKEKEKKFVDNMFYTQDEKDRYYQ